MSKKYAAVMAVMLSLAVAAVAVARTATISVKTSGTILGNVVDLKGANGTIVGEVNDAATGTGAILFPGEGYGKGVKTHFTDFTTKGVLRGVATSDNSISKDGKTGQILNGKVTISGGTGIYRSAKGTGTFSGSQDLASLRVVLHYRLQYTYKK